MSEKQFVARWYAGMAIAATIVATVAALLLTIIGTARSILHHAERALEVANSIVTNTKPIWDLERTNTIAVQLLGGARAIEGHATEVAAALEMPMTAGGSAHEQS